MIGIILSINDKHKGTLRDLQTGQTLKFQYYPDKHHNRVLYAGDQIYYELFHFARREKEHDYVVGVCHINEKKIVECRDHPGKGRRTKK